MSWKSAEKSRRCLFRMSSITGRLAFLYTLSAVVTLLCCALYINWSMRQVMEQADMDFVQSRLQTYRALFYDSPGNPEEVRRDLEWEGANVANPEYYIRIANGSGRFLMETPGMSGVLPFGLFRCVPTQPRRVTSRYLRAANGREYLICCDLEPGRSGTGGSFDGGIIQIGVDVTSEVRAIQRKQVQLVVIFLSGIVLATGGGVLVANRALSPLRGITDVAGEITVERIGERLDPMLWPVELRRFASAFNGMLSRLEDSFTKLSQSASNLAHELRTPINNLLGEAEVALSRQRSPEEYRRTIESSVEECQRLSRLIDNMLFLARADNPALRTDFILFDPAEEIRKVCSFYEAVAEEKGASLSCDGSGLMYGNPPMLERAMSNLIGNALQYSPRGCTIEVLVRQAEDHSLEISVRDTGYGMDADEASQIFDRFFRGERHRTLYPEGSGLGLAIVKSIVDLHGGSVSIESATDVGTTIQLRFPPPIAA